MEDENMKYLEEQIKHNYSEPNDVISITIVDKNPPDLVIQRNISVSWNPFERSVTLKN